MFVMFLYFNAMTAFVISNNDIGMVLVDESYDDKGNGKFDVYFNDDFDSSGDHEIPASIEDLVTIKPVSLITREPVTSVTEGDVFGNFIVNAVQNIIGLISTLFN